MHLKTAKHLKPSPHVQRQQPVRSWKTIQPNIPTSIGASSSNRWGVTRCKTYARTSSSDKPRSCDQGDLANLPNNWRYDTNTSWYLPFSAMSCHIPCRHLTITACLLKSTTHLNGYKARYVRSEKCLSPWWTNMSACWKIHIFGFFLLNIVDLWDIATYTKGSESHPKRLALQSKLQVQTRSRAHSQLS